MTDGVMDSGTSVDPAPTTVSDVPEVAPSPASDPVPSETPATPEPVVEPAQPEEAPVVTTPTEVPPAQAPQAPADALQSSPATPPQPPASASISIKDRAYAALEKIRFNKRKKLDKILVLAAQKRSIKNDDVEKLLKVSDSTAQRYLNQLIKEGKLRRSGTTTSIIYERV